MTIYNLKSTIDNLKFNLLSTIIYNLKSAISDIT